MASVHVGVAWQDAYARTLGVRYAVSQAFWAFLSAADKRARMNVLFGKAEKSPGQTRSWKFGIFEHTLRLRRMGSPRSTLQNSAKGSRRHVLKSKISMAATLAVLAVGGVHAQELPYPSRPVTMVVGFPAGGASDVAARAVAAKMGEQMGQTIIVENKPGAASNIGADAVAKAKPDGYTVLFGTISMAINSSLYKNLSYDPSKDFRPVSQLSSAPFLLVVNPQSPVKSVADLIEEARKPGRLLDYASAGNGSGSHLFTELFSSLAGVKMNHVPYRGAAPAMADVLGNQVPVTFDNIITTLPLVESGKLRALAVSTAKRSSVAPNIPTMQEAGVPGYDATSWFGLFVPAGTPDDVLQTLSRNAVKAVQSPEVSKTFHGQGSEIVGSTPEQFGAFFKAEVAKWADVVKGAGVQVD